MNNFDYCYVPGCRTKLDKHIENIGFFGIPREDSEEVINPLRRRRRQAWIKAIGATKVSKAELDRIRVCRKHFATGRPTSEEDVSCRDWVPNINVPRPLNPNNLVLNIPEVTTQYDVPDYVIIMNEKRIETNLIQKYISSPVCDENGYYINDHDYLGLPILPVKTEKKTDHFIEDHKYALTERPACSYFDSRHFCNICSTNCNNLFAYNNHMAKHTLRNVITCRFCTKKFFTTTCLNNHLMTHTSLCKICGNEVPAVQLKAHKAANERQMSRSNRIHCQKIYFCILCMKKMRTEIEYLRHGDVCVRRN